MALDPGQGRNSISPSGSGRSSSATRIAKRTNEEGKLNFKIIDLFADTIYVGIYKADKALRRYGGTIERALNSWEVSLQEWADYIAFLGRLLKVRKCSTCSSGPYHHSELIRQSKRIRKMHHFYRTAATSHISFRKA